MTRTALQMTPEEWKAYQPGLARARRRPAVARRRRAFEVAKRAADLLRRDFGATKVLAFGSVARPERFTRWSDIDLAAWGSPPWRFFPMPNRNTSHHHAVLP
ncbi:MAG: nucleotidyltransferase family protein [Nitrososphaerales archaeon]